MVSYFVRRLTYAIILLSLISVSTFVIIQLPSGDYLTTYMANLRKQGTVVAEAEVAAIRKQYGLDLPIYVQYFKWIRGMFRGNFGVSMALQEPVGKIIADHLPLSIIIGLFSLAFSYCVAIPIGIYSATHQYSIGDYVATVIGFVGLAIPNFLLALILMVFFYRYFDLNVSGLFSSEYARAGWSVGKFVDLAKHLPIPMIVVGTSGAAGLIRVLRGCLLDELQKQYVITARAKGVAERVLLFKYPVRMAINPLISTIGWLLPAIVSGTVITAIVLNLPTIGPIFLFSLKNQDMYLAGTIIMLLSFLTLIGTFISDILLALTDPRIRYEKKSY